MKIQPYVDSWVSETQADFSYPARVSLWCLSILYPLCVSRFLPCCQSNNSGSFVLPVTSSLLPPSHNPSVMFSIFWECQCATCWHCAWMLTRLYILIENRIPSLPWLLTKNGSNVVQIQDFTVFSYIFM